MSIKDFVKQVHAKKIDVVKNTKEALCALEGINSKHHFMTVVSSDLALAQANAVAKNPKGRLAGLPITVKDCILVKGVESTASSAVLKGYVPLFSATVIDRLIKEGAIILGKTVQDEFGFGTFCLNVGKGIEVPTHPIDPTHVCGGSSGGSGGITRAANFVHASIAETTGGSIESPAAFCGVVGMCPTWGTVSRYGLIDYASSLDKIGPMAKSVEDAKLVWEVMIGQDEKDSTSVKHPQEKTALKTVGVIRALVDKADPEVKQRIKEAEELFKKQGIKLIDIDLPITERYAIETYYVLALAEASTNLAKYCGMRYGATEKLEGDFNEYFSTVSEKYFGAEAKRRILLGTFARMAGHRDALYIQAAKVRRLIINEYKKEFQKCQVLLSPTMPITAPKRSDIEKLTPLQHYAMDLMTVGPNLAGIPHISVPVGESKGLPVGAMLMADHFEEHVLFDAATIIEKKDTN